MHISVCLRHLDCRCKAASSFLPLKPTIYFDWATVFEASVPPLLAVCASIWGWDPAGSAMASDAFFPFRDGLDAAAEHGIKAVIQPGGSMRDAEVVAAADEHGIAMVFTGMRHFRH